MRHEAWMEEDERDERRYDGMIGGIAIYVNPKLAPGTVELRNLDGETIGVIHNVKQIDTCGRR
jgi:hypothetical protein